jgi:hypothetical protein
MYNLTHQVGEAIRHAMVACALISGAEPPVFPDTEPDISQLKARIATAVDFLRSLRPDQVDGAAEKQVVFTFRNGAERKFTGQSLLLAFSVPRFFFHVTTAYDILRHCGVDLIKKDFLERQIKPRLADELDLAAASADQTSRRAAAGHFASERLEPLSRLALAVVHKLHRGIPGHRPGHHRRGIFTDRLVHVIFAIVGAAYRPLETDRRHRTGPKFVIAVGAAAFGGDRRIINRRPFRAAMGLRMIEDTGDGRQRMIGRVALTQDLSLQISGENGESELRRWRWIPFLAREYG